MKKATALLLTAVIAFGMCGCGRIDSRRVDELRDEGYVIEQADDNNICIFEDGIEYYYSTGIFKPALSRIIFHVSPKPESSTDKEFNVTIEPKSFKICMYATRDVTSRFANGNELEWQEVYTFEFKNDLSPENLTNKRGFADISTKYSWFTGNFLTPDELQDIYDRGLELEKEL